MPSENVYPLKILTPYHLYSLFCLFVCLFVCLFDCFSQYCARGAQVGAMGIDILYLRIPTQKNISPSIYDKILILYAIDEGYLMPILRQEVT